MPGSCAQDAAAHDARSTRPRKRFDQRAFLESQVLMQFGVGFKVPIVSGIVLRQVIVLCLVSATLRVVRPGVERRDGDGAAGRARSPSCRTGGRAAAAACFLGARCSGHFQWLLVDSVERSPFGGALYEAFVARKPWTRGASMEVSTARAAPSRAATDRVALRPKPLPSSLVPPRFKQGCLSNEPSTSGNC